MIEIGLAQTEMPPDVIGKGRLPHRNEYESATQGGGGVGRAF
jgi:hypothetical protein